MQREIKFRAWDKEAKTMIYSDKHNKKEYEAEYDFINHSSGNIACWWGVDYDDSFGYPATNSGILDNIMQYTGLKDKNGKEIYEGDIVKFKHEKMIEKEHSKTFLPYDFDTEEYHRNYVVEFANTDTHYGLRLRNKSTWFMVHKMTLLMHDAKVIGNIYENPELLEGSHG